METVLNFKLEPTPEGETVIPAIPAGDKAEDCVLPRFDVKTIDFKDRDYSNSKLLLPTGGTSFSLRLPRNAMLRSRKACFNTATGETALKSWKRLRVALPLEQLVGQ